MTDYSDLKDLFGNTKNDNGEDDQATESSWRPVDLTTIQPDTEKPRWLHRTDGLALLYPGRIQWISGEPETAKSWFTLTGAGEVLNAGGRVAFVDYEDDAAGFLARCAALGIAAIGHHKADRLRYIQPTDPVTAGRNDNRYTPGRLALVDLCAWQPDLAILDGVTAGMDLEGLDPERNSEVATWLAAVARPLARAGAAVPCLDHVTKSREGRGRWAIGAQHKLAAIDGAAYLIETIQPVARAVGPDPIEGVYRLTITKDRRGHIRGHPRQLHHRRHRHHRLARRRSHRQGRTTGPGVHRRTPTAHRRTPRRLRRSNQDRDPGPRQQRLHGCRRPRARQSRTHHSQSGRQRTPPPPHRQRPRKLA
jgi:hypothetical protein